VLAFSRVVAVEVEVTVVEVVLVVAVAKWFYWKLAIGQTKYH
jgi:hypothetical protein